VYLIGSSNHLSSSSSVGGLPSINDVYLLIQLVEFHGWLGNGRVYRARTWRAV
jgi:hypothetical protein